MGVKVNMSQTKKHIFDDICFDRYRLQISFNLVFEQLKTYFEHFLHFSLLNLIFIEIIKYFCQFRSTEVHFDEYFNFVKNLNETIGFTIETRWEALIDFSHCLLIFV